MKTKKKEKVLSLPNSNELRLLVSSDILAIPLKDELDSNEDYDILLNGNDTNVYILSGDQEQIFTIIDQCYRARESSLAVIITCQGGKTIVFS